MTKLKSVARIDKTIKVRVIGKANILQDNDGVLRAEIRYDDKAMEKQVDKILLPLLEEIVGFEHMRLGGELVPSSSALISFRCSMMSDSPWLRQIRENNLRKIKANKETK